MEIRAGWGCQENAVSPDKNRHSRGKSRTCLALRLASCQCKTVWLADQCTPAVFSRYQERHPEIQFVGIAADTDGNVREFATKNHYAYPLLLGSRDAFPLMAELGNMRRALPFTVTWMRTSPLTSTVSP